MTCSHIAASQYAGGAMTHKQTGNSATDSPIRERPILFSAPMIRAILAGQKTQTRRLCKSNVIEGSDGKPLVPMIGKGTYLASQIPTREEHDRNLYSRCPYGTPGDRLWVRETWAPVDGEDERGAIYAATHPMSDGEPMNVVLHPAVPFRWTPSIYMPRKASRILLAVESVRVERLQAITEDDVYAEGVTIPVTDTDDKGQPLPAGKVRPLHSLTGKHPSFRYLPKDWTAEDAVRSHFASLWDGINGKRAPWSSNPFVWVVTFKRLEPS